MAMMPRRLTRTVDPRLVGGVSASMRLNDTVFFDEAGITAGVNHGYLRPFCNCCMRTNCPWDEDMCCNGPCEAEGVESIPAEMREIKFSHNKAITTFRSKKAADAGHALVRTVLEDADEIVLCPCKQFFAFKDNTHCMVCIAATAAERAGECMVCNESGASTKTSCCSQFLHSFCNKKIRKAECPHCKVKEYIVA